MKKWVEKRRHVRQSLSGGHLCAFCAEPVVEGLSVANFQLCVHHWALVLSISMDAGVRYAFL